MKILRVKKSLKEKVPGLRNEKSPNGIEPLRDTKNRSVLVSNILLRTLTTEQRQRAKLR
jgi:hypothetical protein